MMSARLILHVGLDKTGTTAIQQFLADNEDHFLSRKILYPKTGRLNGVNHHGLFGVISNDLHAREFGDKLDHGQMQ